MKMKVYRTKPDEYGWYTHAYLRKDGYLDLEKKKVDGSNKEHWQWIQIHIKDLMKILKELKKEEDD